jgi:hypothetical protein
VSAVTFSGVDAAEADRAVAVGEALRKARGSMSRAKAVRASGLSVQWWVDAEKGMRRDRGEWVPTVLRPANLASAVYAVGGDIEEIFELAGFDPVPYFKTALLVNYDEELESRIAKYLADLTVAIGGLREEIEGMRYDLRMIGAGAVGSQAAADLASSGVSELLVEVKPGRRSSHAARQRDEQAHTQDPLPQS